jgi:hypothetical protein
MRFIEVVRMKCYRVRMNVSDGVTCEQDKPWEEGWPVARESDGMEIADDDRMKKAKL